MKNYFLSLSAFFLTCCIYSTQQSPITLIIYNTTDQELNVSLNYQLMQHYSKHKTSETPFVPNNNQSHNLQIIKPSQKKVVSIFAFHPCAQPFCFLEKNLKTYGFKHHYKLIQGSITITNWNRSYDFKETIFDGGVITCKIKRQSISVSATKSFYALSFPDKKAHYYSL